MTKHAQPGNGAPSQFPWMTSPSGLGMEAFARAGEACNKACLAWQEELVRFTTARAQSDSELGQKLVACRNWADAAKLQQEWAASMAQDYFDEANRLAQLASKFSADLMMRPAGDVQHAAE